MHLGDDKTAKEEKTEETIRCERLRKFTRTKRILWAFEGGD
jgi:hypothetical protein